MSLCELSREMSINTKQISIQPNNFLFFIKHRSPLYSHHRHHHHHFHHLDQHSTTVFIHSFPHTYTSTVYILYIFLFFFQRSSIFCVIQASMLYLRMNVKECLLLLLVKFIWRKSSTNNRHLFSFLYILAEHWFCLDGLTKKKHT